jgi:cell division protein ZapE
MSSFSEVYRDYINQGLLKEDAEQAEMALKLSAIGLALEKQKRLFHRKKLVKGLYAWGSVGVGKTHMMDLFFEHLPFDRKLRLHFHVFMKRVHESLTRLQGHANPLKMLAKEFAKQAKILCFDEFIVTDITDAMLLGNLVKALFEEGVCFVATSNIPPDELYRNGIQHDRFVPVIKLIEKHTDVLHLKNNIDYRLRHLVSEGAYFTSLDADAEHHLLKSFLHFSSPPRQKGEVITVEGREIHTIQLSNEVAWFDFNVICPPPRCQRDYISLAETYEAVIVSHVPRIDAQNTDVCRNFISMIDMFYDMQIKLILSAEVPIDELYREGRLSFEFKRTKSRLIEMQSLDYLRQ